MNQSLIELRKKPHTSVSAIKTFLSCPRKFHLSYVLKTQPAFRPAALVFGSAWHDTIGVWLSDDTVGIQQLRDHLRDGLAARLRGESNVLFDDEDDDEGSLVDTAVRMLDAFITLVPRPEKTLAVEMAFQLEVAHPVTGEVLPVPLIGALDAVVLEGGRGAVWELKSGKKKWSDDQFEFDLQATAYGIAAREGGYDGVDLKFLITTKTKKPDVQRETVIRHRADEDELAEIAFGVHRAVEAGVDYPNRGWQCGTCQYAAACRS
jgi:CRISPR/Cas system-associated exonuclease Cas4 (RecB family)